jgi:hypothetical protein
MRNSINIFIIFLTLGVYSCESILDREPLDQISDAVVWKDPSLIEAYLFQVYAKVPFHASLDQNEASSLKVLLPIAVTDQGFSKKSHELGAKKWKQNLLDEQGGLFEYWPYLDIRRANEFLQLIETSELEEKDLYAAEMRFLRAFMYFELAKRYGAVPLILVPQDVEADSAELFVPRNSEKEIYDFINDELEAITTILPEVHPAGFGRATKYAAAALNSRAMMYAASAAQWGTQHLDGLLGFPASEASDYWQKSYDASKIILGEDLQGGVHALYNMHSDKVKNFQEIFLDEKNIEVIFANQYAGLDILGHNWDLFNAPTNRGAALFVEEKQATSISVYLEMAEEFEYSNGSPGTLFESRDPDVVAADSFTINDLFGFKEPRFHASLFYHGAVWRDIELDWKKWDIIDGEKVAADLVSIPKYQEQTGFGIKKYVSDRTIMLPQWASSDVDFIVFRFGEILLNFAEAAYELGYDGEALTAINELRARVDLPDLSSIDREKIRHERKVELAFEGNRFWDLRRWRTAVDEISRIFYGIEYAQIENSDYYRIYIVGGDRDGSFVCNVSEKYYYFPITPNRLANNPNLGPENPYY